MSFDISKLQRTKVTKDFGSMNVLAYGNPKVGKTTLASKQDGALFLATERGHNFVEVHKVDITKWEDVYEVGKQLKGKDHKFKTLVVDIADYFYKHCEHYIMKKHGVDHPSDLAYGKGFSLVKDEFTRAVTGLNQMGFGMFFISHGKEKTVKTKTAEWTMMGTSMGASPEKVISGMCDLILYCYISEEGERLCRTKPTKYILAGDRSGKLPSVMSMDYEKIVAALNAQSKLNELPNEAKKIVERAKNTQKAAIV